MRHGFRMSVGAHPGGVGEVNAAFAGFAEAHALPAAVRRSLNVALDELLKRFPDWTVDLENSQLSSSSTTRGWRFATNGLPMCLTAPQRATGKPI